MVRNWLPPSWPRNGANFWAIRHSKEELSDVQLFGAMTWRSEGFIYGRYVHALCGNGTRKFLRQEPLISQKKNWHRIDWIKSRLLEVNSATSWTGLRTHLPALMFHVRTCTAFLIWFNILVVGPRSWRILFESPDRLASMTQTTIFTDNEQCHKWADELINILLQSAGHKFGKMTSCFFSNCCGYEYAHNSVKPTRIPRVLYDMMAHLMPHCGMSARELWPTGINVNYYPDGYAFFSLHSLDDLLS